jgi:hypothetical protein
MILPDPGCSKFEGKIRMADTKKDIAIHGIEIMLSLREPETSAAPGTKIVAQKQRAQKK